MFGRGVNRKRLYDLKPLHLYVKSNILVQNRFRYDWSSKPQPKIFNLWKSELENVQLLES